VPVTALVLSFALDELRARFPAPAGADPRHDTAAFRAFRDRLLAAAVASARAPASLEFAWHGTFNGYALVVAVAPAEAVPGLEVAAGEVCPLDDVRVAPAPPAGYPLGRVAPGEARVARETDGSTHEAPFGAATGHFGAPGVRRIR
jgi:hypothetical protein